MTASSGIPTTKFPVIWGSSAGAGYIRTPPVASQIGAQNGAASFTTGFVPLNFVPTQSGGIPPFGQDFNGILELSTAWLQWEQMGGPVFYDATFSAAIGGYPKGAVLCAAANNGTYWISTADNNTSNPDTGGSGWVTIQGLANTWTAANTFTQTVTGDLGFVATFVDAGGAHFRAINGNYAGFLQNNGVGCYLLQTSSGNQYGSSTSLRPFYWNFVSGAVTIDGTGAGTTMGGTLATGGAVTIDGQTAATQPWASALPGRLLGVQVFTGVNGFTYTPTSGATQTICTVQAPGGPGGATTATSGSQAAVGGGGGSGALAEVEISLSGIASLSVFLGGAGTAAAGVAGAAGGTTTVSAGATTLISCPGGNAAPLGSAISTSALYIGVPAGMTAYPSYAGTAITAYLRNVPGQAGHTGLLYGTAGVTSGRGADGAYGGAGGAPSSGAGNAGAGYGAGGSGAGALTSAAALAGGSGAGAIVVFRDYT